MNQPRVPIIGTDVRDVLKNVEVLQRRMTAEGRDPEGLVVHLYQMLGHAPSLLNAWSGLGAELRVGTEISPAIRELVILRGSLLANAMYEWAHHFEPARKAGHSQRKLADLGAWPDSDQFSELERAVLALTDEVVQAYRPSEATWSEVSKHLTDRALVELVVLISFYACVSRILLTLQIPVEPDYRDQDDWIAAWTTARVSGPTSPKWENLQ